MENFDSGVKFVTTLLVDFEFETKCYCNTGFKANFMNCCLDQLVRHLVLKSLDLNINYTFTHCLNRNSNEYSNLYLPAISLIDFINSTYFLLFNLARVPKINLRNVI